ncbi:MAG: hypothetical protein KUA37_11655 [Desulfomicrobium sp.]|nr:hypothetical protein [Desulfomicrobium sp.]
MARLLRMKPELESMVEDNEASPLTLAAEQYATVNKYAGAFLQAFTFRSARHHDPLLAAIALLKRLHLEKRRSLPERIPIIHLSQADRRLILGQQKPDRRLYEIATLAVLRDRLRSADIWVEVSIYTSNWDSDNFWKNVTLQLRLLRPESQLKCNVLLATRKLPLFPKRV